MQTTPKTLFDKIWERHVVVPESEDTPAVLYIDLHLIHEVTTPQAFTLLREKDLRVRAPEKVLATICLLYTSPSPRDATLSRMPSSA